MCENNEHSLKRQCCCQCFCAVESHSAAGPCITSALASLFKYNIDFNPRKRRAVLSDAQLCAPMTLCCISMSLTSSKWHSKHSLDVLDYWRWVGDNGNVAGFSWSFRSVLLLACFICIAGYCWTFVSVSGPHFGIFFFPKSLYLLLLSQGFAAFKIGHGAKCF